jgi:hypothetical protein
VAVGCSVGDGCGVLVGSAVGVVVGSGAAVTVGTAVVDASGVRVGDGGGHVGDGPGGVVAVARLDVTGVEDAERAWTLLSRPAGVAVAGTAKVPEGVGRETSTAAGKGCPAVTGVPRGGDWSRPISAAGCGVGTSAADADVPPCTW